MNYYNSHNKKDLGKTKGKNLKFRRDVFKTKIRPKVNRNNGSKREREKLQKSRSSAGERMT